MPKVNETWALAKSTVNYFCRLMNGVEKLALCSPMCPTIYTTQARRKTDAGTALRNRHCHRCSHPHHLDRVAPETEDACGLSQTGTGHFTARRRPDLCGHSAPGGLTRTPCAKMGPALRGAGPGGIV